ncbi:MarR family winged helix-turn-helix transcriptional regulator [Protofrankia symbiont of Coriaria ruscifolia]|uniref:MarR family winged helix-turn-helix transcriptional regulator n=1 Tax=Protofrankia symbiont of Coriaria ruscifolia TaxID=1306542 RepID=UPI001A9512B8|nr:MarR family transcriptional regulator [Protofrankia symbiont of Coriaria ruscifolia]
MATAGRAVRSGEVALWRQVGVLAARVNQAVDRALVRRHALTLSELTALLTLCEGPERGSRIQDLADAVGLNQSSMSRLTARLAAAGLAERVSCEYDRRGVYCAVTTQGRAAVAAAESTLREELGKALEAAALDPRTAAAVARLRYDAVVHEGG